jgi:Ca2+-binding EF-hand superfamily protein
MANPEQKLSIMREFKKLDKDSSGFLSHDELRIWILDLAKEINLNMTENDIEMLISKVDKDQDGQISIEEFLKLI